MAHQFVASNLSEKLLSSGGGDDPSLMEYRPRTAGDTRLDHNGHDEEEVIVFNEGLMNGSSSFGGQSQSSHHGANSEGILQGQPQEKKIRDFWAALTFAAHLVGIFYLAIAWGVPSLQFESRSYGETQSYDFGGILWLSVLSSFAAMIMAAFSLTVMMHCARLLVQVSLLVTTILQIGMVVFFIWQKYWIGVGVSAVMLVWGAAYAYVVWKRIPFAAANLETALTAVRANMGITVPAYGLALGVNLFSMVWLLASVGVFVRSSDCEDGACSPNRSSYGWVVILLLLSYYWTVQVFKNLLHVTVAGVVGTWWFAPEDASRFCSPAIQDSFLRASTYSLGSIAFGSLLTASLQVAYHLTRSARQHGRSNQLLLCVLECIVGQLERLVAYFNKWAYTYIGLYGYDYLTAGKKVMSLFMERGWSTIINDNLVMRVLMLMSIMIGGLTGVAGILIATAKPDWIDEFGMSTGMTVAFVLPFMIGTGISYILMSVVGSAVDTIIVAFAEAPLEFERNHPGMYAQMVAAWREVYPDEFTVTLE